MLSRMIAQFFSLVDFVAAECPSAFADHGVTHFTPRAHALTPAEGSRPFGSFSGA
jgi:hypothetical protein